ncbi:MAG: HEAT repeat domain-containing protein, partial [Planctomycetes bacterium]|nr:HEAT repeat domain-containing protein [Planctomycetota bacterium]
MRRRLAAASLLLAAACGSSDERQEPASEAAIVLPGARGAAVELTTSRELEEVAHLEDARSLGDGRLLELLSSERDIRVRERSATALGRFPYPRFGVAVTEALVRALEDPALDVRLAAAFALGVRGDPSGSGTLLAYRNDPEPRLRARVVEAASRLPGPGEHAQLVLSLRDADLSVRMEAAVGTARWERSEDGAGEIDRALLDALSPYRISRETAPKSAVEAELVWRILWALGRRKAELGRGPFLEYARAEVALERLFALRGLAQLAPDVAGVRAVIAALVGPLATRDWRIAYEATMALKSFGAHDEDRLAPTTRELLASDEVLAALE